MRPERDEPPLTSAERTATRTSDDVHRAARPAIRRLVAVLALHAILLCTTSASAVAQEDGTLPDWYTKAVDVSVGSPTSDAPIPGVQVFLEIGARALLAGTTDDEGLVDLSGFIDPGDDPDTPATITLTELLFRGYGYDEKVVHTTLADLIHGYTVTMLRKENRPVATSSPIRLLWEKDSADHWVLDRLTPSIPPSGSPAVCPREVCGAPYVVLDLRATPSSAARVTFFPDLDRDGVVRGFDGEQTDVEYPGQIDDRSAVRSSSDGGFALWTATYLFNPSSPAFLETAYDSEGRLTDSSFHRLVPSSLGVTSPQTMDREEEVGAFFYSHESRRYEELDRSGDAIQAPFPPGGFGTVLDDLFGGLSTRAVPLGSRGGAAATVGRTTAGSSAGDGTLVFSSRSTSPTVLFDFVCRAGQSRLFLTEYEAGGAIVVDHQLGDPIPTQVGHGCFPPYTQQTSDVEYGESWGVAYQVGDELRLSTRSLERAATPRTYSLGSQPATLDGVNFWDPALLGDPLSGGVVIHVPNGAKFELAEDGERLGFPPWPLANPTLDLPLVASGELLTHELVADLSGVGWLFGTFERGDLAEPPPTSAELLVAGVALPGCLDTDAIFCANHNRFAVSARYSTPQGAEGVAHARPLSNDSGTFWFFAQDNRELIVKVLDACGLNGHFWFFAAGLTNVGVQLELWDRLTGEAVLYANPIGEAFAPILDTTAIECDGNAAAREMEAAVAELEAAEPSTPIVRTSAKLATDGTDCGGDPDDLCLNGGRFRVAVEFTDFAGATKSAFGGNLTDDTGALFFFDQANVEMLIKILDACVLNQRFWVFAAGLTNVGVEITVTDTESGASAVYRNPLGSDFVPISDTSTFGGCS